MISIPKTYLIDFSIVGARGDENQINLTTLLLMKTATVKKRRPSSKRKFLGEIDYTIINLGFLI